MIRRLHKIFVSGSDQVYPALYVQVYIINEDKVDNPYPLMSAFLTDLGFYENTLDRDRFLFYRPVAQPHSVLQEVRADTSLSDEFTERLNWIGKHVCSPWSFELHMVNTLAGTLTWSFQKASDATLFKLTF